MVETKIRAAMLALCCCATPDRSGTATVIDGDTLDLNGKRYRLHGIDAPERAQKCKTSSGTTWSCGRAATRALVALIGTSDITCLTHDVDKYNRDIATCHANGQDLGRQLVSGGMAWAFVKYSERYTAEQSRAKAAGIGIWQGPAEPAWQFRQKS